MKKFFAFIVGAIWVLSAPVFILGLIMGQGSFAPLFLIGVPLIGIGCSMLVYLEKIKARYLITPIVYFVAVLTFQTFKERWDKKVQFEEYFKNSEFYKCSEAYGFTAKKEGPESFKITFFDKQKGQIQGLGWTHKKKIYDINNTYKRTIDRDIDFKKCIGQDGKLLSEIIDGVFVPR